MDLKKLADQYKDELLDNVLPFWLEHSQDHEHGGYFTCLDRKGNVFDYLVTGPGSMVVFNAL